MSLRWFFLTLADDVSRGALARAAARPSKPPTVRIVANWDGPVTAPYKDGTRRLNSIRFGSFPNRLTVRISGSHPGDRGSIPRSGAPKSFLNSSAGYFFLVSHILFISLFLCHVIPYRPRIAREGRLRRCAPSHIHAARSVRPPPQSRPPPQRKPGWAVHPPIRATRCYPPGDLV